MTTLHSHSNQFQLCEACLSGLVLGSNQVINSTYEVFYLLSEAVRIENIAWFLRQKVFPLLQWIGRHGKIRTEEFIEFTRMAHEVLKIVFYGVGCLIFTMGMLIAVFFPSVARRKTPQEEERLLKEQDHRAKEQRDREWRVERKEQWAWEDAQKAGWEARRKEHWASQDAEQEAWLKDREAYRDKQDREQLAWERQRQSEFEARKDDQKDKRSELEEKGSTLNSDPRKLSWKYLDEDDAETRHVNNLIRGLNDGAVDIEHVEQALDSLDASREARFQKTKSAENAYENERQARRLRGS